MGHNDDERLSTQHNLTPDIYKRRKFKDASRLDQTLLSVRKKNLRKDNYERIACGHGIAANLHAPGEYERAMALIQQNLLLLRRARMKRDCQLEAVLRYPNGGPVWYRRAEEAKRKKQRK